MIRRLLLLITVLLLGALVASCRQSTPSADPSSSAPSPVAPGSPAATPATAPDTGGPSVKAADLPQDARDTIALIKKGGPYPYRRDGIVFHNRERKLPPHPQGYYHEYTVRTPGERTRGAKRVITGSGGELYYTDDHYRSFRRVVEQ